MKHEIRSCHRTTKICFGRVAGLYLRLQWLILNLSLFWIIRLTYFRSFPTEVIFLIFINSFCSIVLSAWLYSVLFSFIQFYSFATSFSRMKNGFKNWTFVWKKFTFFIQRYNIKEKHIWQVYVTSELKIELFCFFTIGTMVWIFIVVKNRYLIFFGSTKIHNDSKWNKRSWNKLMQFTNSNSHPRSIFP